MKTNRNLLLLAGAVAFTIIAVTVLADSTSLPEPALPPPPAEGAPAGGHHERHPAIRGAIRALEKAKTELQHADHDFGGHRAEALAECDRGDPAVAPRPAI